METVETPVRKTGRPTTRLTARARSNSLGNQPLTPEAPLIVAIPPIVDLVVVEQPDRVEQPRVENATIPPPNPPDNDAREQAAPDAPAAEEPEIPRVDPKQHANQCLRREAERIVYECQELLEIYDGIQLNQPLLNKLVSMSDASLADISSCCAKMDVIEELADASRELKRWQRIIKTFMISKLGSYETPAPTASTTAQPPTPSPPPTTTALIVANPTPQTTDIATTKEQTANINPTAEDAGDSTTNNTSDATPPMDNSPPPPTDGVQAPEARAQQNDAEDAEQQANARLMMEVHRILDECQEFLEIYEGIKLNQPLINDLVSMTNALLTDITNCLIKLTGIEALADASREVKRWQRIIKTFKISKLGSYEAPDTPAPSHNPAPSAQAHREKRDASPNTLELIHRDLIFFMSKLSDDYLPDVGLGADVPNSEIRDLHDFTLHQITKAIDDCRHALKTYTSNASYDRKLAREAQERCEYASIWTNDLVERYHRQKIHLDKNIKHREITFTMFKPGGEISIYQFLNQFETWADGYLSEEAKADQLFHKYLDKSITEGYTEISLLKENFQGMKGFLIKKYGSVVPMAHGCIKSISRMTVPNESDNQASVHYLRSIHRVLVNLSQLEITKGVPVPKLQNYLGSNAFLSALIEALPMYIKDKLFDDLIKDGIDDIGTIEGKHHLTAIVRIIKAKFMRAELFINSSPTPIPPPKQQSQPQPKKNTKPASNAPYQSSNITNTPQQNVNPSALPQSPTYSNAQPPFLTGGNAVPISNARPQSQQQNQSNWNRWSCPIRDHHGHNISDCTDFWNMNPKERRFNCKYGGCYTCLERNRNCRGGTCTRYQEVPADLICPDCAQVAKNGKTPVCIVMCGIDTHRKPAIPELMRALEAWIPNLNFQRIGAQVTVNLTALGFHSTAFMPPPPRSKTGPPTPAPNKVVYDTTTGRPQPISKNVLINKTSSESAFYAMQTVKIKNQEVLIFYDSGSNGHLIEGDLAEDLELDVVTSESVPVGALGGKAMWSEYGLYTVTLGPDMYGEYHELEMQGISSITNRLPEVDLQELWDEANLALHGRRQMPIKIGGSCAHILIGIKSTQLSPKHKYSLPNGLGIYESVLFDIYQSNICFGGPHAVFTQAYRKLGLSGNHVQVMFTEVARAYMESPKTFIRVDVEEHGPPQEFARELDIMEEFTNAFPQSSKQKESKSSFMTVDHDIIRKDTAEVPDIVDDCVKPTEKIEDVEEPETDGTQFNNLLDHCEHINCMKSFVPLSKLKGLQDELDIPEIVEFRCDACANCPTCKLSARAKTKSLQESFEQEVIEKSVHVNLEEARVWVDLPFIKEPVEYLTKKHGGPNNFNQAFKVYQAQCKKRDDVKDQVRKAHGELVEKGYMLQLVDLPKDLQDTVNNAPFQHYYPWRAVYKEDSVTTPVRLVVDPTMTGLNEILAKGVNMLSKIPELLVRFRCFKRTWNTDISKLYNQLHLNKSSLAFSLFLFHSNLDQRTPPSVWVMSRAWYGVSSTGNQAGVAIEFLAHQFRETYPDAFTALISSRYVDDILSGANSEAELESQILQTQECLKAGGFSLKYVARSGQKPPSKASVNGTSVGCLGLSWNTEEDTLSLAFNEDFFLKRLKGQKPPPDISLKDTAVLDEALNNNLITRAGILSRVAELYDPCGWWEPIKVQMKLAMKNLNGLLWTDPVPPDCRKDWTELFHTMNQLKSIQIARSVLPEEATPQAKIRIITIADAAAHSCGSAIYAGVEEPGGSFSCNLILAKSKMVHGTIPRNELEGVVLAAESSLMVQRALADKMDSIRYYTDSRIVVCWVLNQSKRLRMWAFNRVQAIHSMIKRQQDGEDTVPLYHINGLENIADLLTKVRPVRPSDLQTTSAWHTGLKWMTLTQ
jgi:hypothetical protein